MQTLRIPRILSPENIKINANDHYMVHCDDKHLRITSLFMNQQMLITNYFCFCLCVCKQYLTITFMSITWFTLVATQNIY